MEVLIKRGAADEKERISEEKDRLGNHFWPEKTHQQEKIEVFTDVDELLDPDVTEDTSEPINTSGSLDVEFDENELQAELERLEKNLNESSMLSSASLSLPATTEEEKTEDESLDTKH